MKSLLLLIISFFFISCVDNTHNFSNNSIEGTWKLISGTLIEKGDTSVTHYDKNVSFIKILNKTHFTFLQHDLKKGQDSTTSFFQVVEGTHLSIMHIQNT